MSEPSSRNASWYQRILLPGFIFKGVVIGGGYATGRELVEFFFGSGPRGALQGILLAMAIWSLVCVVTFMLARAFSAYDYRSFFKALLGPFWILFEIAYVALVVLVIAVLAAAAGTTGNVMFGLPDWVGTALLMAIIVGVCTFGSEAVEKMFKFSSAFLYLVYILFVVFAFSNFGDRIGEQLARPLPTTGWVLGGITYASYNIVAAAAVLPFLQHQRSQREALVAGLISGPLAMLPGLLFFLSMVAFYPEIGNEALPSNFLLRQFGQPWFYFLFNAMIFIALLETGVGGVNAVTERVATAYEARKGRELPRASYFGLALLIVVGSGVIAVQVGLIDLIAKGYGFFGYVMLAVFIVPVLTIGVWRLWQSSRAPLAEPTVQLDS